MYLGGSKWEDIIDLKRSLFLLDKYFNRKYQYPIIIFNEDYNSTLKEHFKNDISVQPQFIKVKLRIPDWIDKNEIPEYFDDKWNIGYRHMCRFLSYYAYTYLEDYEYYWRLDTDSFIRASIEFDPFEIMKKEQAIHGYVGTFKESPKVIKELLPTVDKHFGYKIFWDRECYQMNFDISKTSYWLNDPYKSYFDYLDKSGGIYKYRWGDIPIRTIALNEFGAKVKKLNIKYRHQHFRT